MKRLFLIAIILALLATTSSAQDTTIWLPIILKGRCYMPAIFQIEDASGSNILDLIHPDSGFHLSDWTPAISDYKRGGTWQDSPLADGRRLVDSRFANVIETIQVKVNDTGGQDLVIRTMQEARRLFEKASRYWTSDWQDDIVYLKVQATCESNPRYAAIYRAYLSTDDNPFAQPFQQVGGGAVLDNLTLFVERGPWQPNAPGGSACVEASGEQFDWPFEDIWELNTNQPVAGVGDIFELSAGRLLASETDEVWRTDDGAIWNAATTPPNGPNFFGVTLAEVTTTGNVILAGVTNPGGVSQTWRSVNAGVDWAIRNAANGAPFTIRGPNVLVYRASDGFLYLCNGNGANIDRSSDEGLNWTTVHTVTAARGIFLSSDDVLYASVRTSTTINAIVRSTDGVNWTTVFQRTLTAGTDDINVFTEGGGFLFAGTLAGEILRSSDGISWAIISDPALISTVGDMLYFGGSLYVTDGTQVRVSTDDGISWVTSNANAFVATALPLAVRASTTLYMGDNGNIYILDPNNAVDLGRSATCNDEVYIANKANVSNLTHVKESDGGVFTDLFPIAAFPTDLFPAVPVANDACYFGTDTTMLSSGPFSSLVFDLSSAFEATTYTLIWEYWNGGWVTLDVTDNTLSMGAVGVNSVHWVPPSDWATTTVDGITGYWVRARISAIAGPVDVPAQQNRDIYTINWPRVDVDELQVLGDISALMRYNLRNHSDEDGYDTVDSPGGLDSLDDRILSGLRSINRGSTFIAYLNCADEQNPAGVTAADGANTTDVNDIDAPSGRSMEHTTTGSNLWTDECTFSLDPTIARDFYGTYHAFFRGQLESFSSAVTEVRVRLQVRTGSGGITTTTDWVNFNNDNDWQLLDLGRVTIPASGLLALDELGDQTDVVIQIWSSVAQLVVNLYDLVLIPVDEWAGDFVDRALEADSGVQNNWLLDVDSVSFPKRKIRALVRDAADFVRSIYESVTPSPAILQANADQRLWFLSARAAVYGTHTGAADQTTLTDSGASFLTSNVRTGQVIYNITDGSVGVVGATVTATTITDSSLTGGAEDDWDNGDEYLIIAPSWRSEPWVAHSIQLFANARYLGMRGDR
ncbi:MAG: WD40/YVTN/BNR-like repeat-containing protein [Planctomycetota bacterium]|jgi:hypothetical protein